MIKFKKLTIALLALLSVSAGAWAAEESETIRTATSGKFSYTGEHFTVKENLENAWFVDGDGLRISNHTDFGHGSATITSLNGEVIVKIELIYGWGDEYSYATTSTQGIVSSDGKTITDINATTVTISNSLDEGVQVNEWKIYYSTPAGTMSLSADGLSATMKMPASDVTVSYDLVRDLSQSSPVFSGLPDGDQAIVKKDGDNYTFKAGAPAITLNDPLADNADIITSEDLNVEVNKYGASMTFEKTIALADFLANPEPGTYEIIVRGTDNGSYDGWVGTPYFTLTEQYDLALQPADAFSAGKLSEVTVGGTAVTLGADGTATTTAQPAQEVILKAKRGYVIEEVKAKKNVPVTLSEATVGMVVGSDGKAYGEGVKMPSGVTAAAMVAFKNGPSGLAIALTDEASPKNWSTANGTSGAAAHTPAVEGQTWKLPSRDEWKLMFSANGGSETSYIGLNTAITNAGGKAFYGSSFYWSSSEKDDANAYAVYLSGGAVNFYTQGKSEARPFRAVLAF